jgi:hypothetical protein
MSKKTGTLVETEEPKTTVDGETAEVGANTKAPKAPKEVKIPVNIQYRILDGVDVTKFNGQRACVVKGMQKLLAERGPDDSFTIPEIVAASEGLQSKTPLEASAKFHVMGLIKDGAVAKVEVAPLATIG